MRKLNISGVSEILTDKPKKITSLYNEEDIIKLKIKEGTRNRDTVLNTCITDQNWTDRPLSNLYIYIVIIETLINLEMVLVIQKTIFLQLKQEKLCPK